MEKRLFQFVIGIVGLWVVLHYWHPFWRYDLNEAVDASSTQKLIFTIDKGESAKQIANGLYEKDLIVSSISFVRDVKEQNLDQSLRYGSFVLSPSMSLSEIVKILTTEGTGTLALTIPEGFTIEQIDARLTEMGLITAGEFKTCTFNCTFENEFLPKNRNTLEGYLFPDTYFIDDANFTVESTIQQMLQNFGTKLEEIQKDLDESDYSLAQIVNVASMLEKEVKDPADLPIVAGIIWKRLEADWFLGIDATLLYMDKDGELSSEDLKSEGPYNTRTQKGLPPSAIGNPGLAALKAALHPKETTYWYYLTGSDGLMYYAETNAEHEANKAEHL